MPWFRCFPQRRSFFRFPSLEEPFKSVVNNATWREDRVFAEQRLAGLNPMSLMKVTEGQGESHFNLFYEFISFITSTFTSFYHKTTNSAEAYNLGCASHE